MSLTDPLRLEAEEGICTRLAVCHWLRVARLCWDMSPQGGSVLVVGKALEPTHMAIGEGSQHEYVGCEGPSELHQWFPEDAMEHRIGPQCSCMSTHDHMHFPHDLWLPMLIPASASDSPRSSLLCPSFLRAYWTLVVDQAFLGGSLVGPSLCLLSSI